MPIIYKYEIDSRIVYAKASELVTTKDLLNYVTSIIEYNFIEVVDFQFVKNLEVSYSDLTPFPSIGEKYMKKGCKAVLIYAPTDLSYGTFRMLQTVVASKHEVAEDLFVVVRSKDILDNKLKELLA